MLQRFKKTDQEVVQQLRRKAKRAPRLGNRLLGAGGTIILVAVCFYLYIARDGYFTPNLNSLYNVEETEVFVKGMIAGMLFFGVFVSAFLLIPFGVYTLVRGADRRDALLISYSDRLEAAGLLDEEGRPKP